MMTRLETRVEKPGAKHDCAMNPSFNSFRHTAWSSRRQSQPESKTKQSSRVRGGHGEKKWSPPDEDKHSCVTTLSLNKAPGMFSRYPLLWYIMS